MVFSSEFKKLRKKCLLSQEEFAKELGVAFSTVNRWENGKEMPTYKSMRLIMTYCKDNNIQFDIQSEWLGEDK